MSFQFGNFFIILFFFAYVSVIACHRHSHNNRNIDWHTKSEVYTYTQKWKQRKKSPKKNIYFIEQAHLLHDNIQSRDCFVLVGVPTLLCCVMWLSGAVAVAVSVAVTVASTLRTGSVILPNDREPKL